MYKIIKNDQKLHLLDIYFDCLTPAKQKRWKNSPKNNCHILNVHVALISISQASVFL